MSVDRPARESPASWRLVRLLGLIAIITAVFTFSFSQVYSGRQLTYLLYSLYVIAVVSAISAFVLGTVRFMDEQDRTSPVPEPDDDTQTLGSARTASAIRPDDSQADDAPVETVDEPEAETASNQPIPIVLNFQEELDTVAEYFGDDEPPAFEDFKQGYRRLRKSGRANRDNIVSDLKATMNPILTQLESDDGATDALEAAEAIDENLFTYVDREPSELLTIDSADLFVDGQPVPAVEAQGATARIKARVRNQGDKTNSKVRLQFLGSDGVRLTDSYLSLGPVGEGQVKELNTNVYVPSLAHGYDIQAVEADEREEFYQM
jgi:hypothetical protein